MRTKSESIKLRLIRKTSYCCALSKSRKLSLAMKKLVVLTTEYVVQDNDTVEKIAARFDCTPSQLIKLNKLTSRMLFTGQNILVPDGTTVEEIVEDLSLMQQPPLRQLSRGDSHDGHRRSSNPLTQADDAECIRKFFKVHTNYLLGGSSGKATGVFIVTPNCAMFDPDVEPDEQFDEVQEKYGVVAPIDDVISISLYEMKLEKPARRKTRRSSSKDKDEILRSCSPSSEESAPSRSRPCHSVDHSSTHFDPLSDYGHEENVRRRSLVFTRESRTLSPLVIKRKLTNSIQKLRDTWRSNEFSDIQEGKISNVAGPLPLLRVASRHSSSVDDNEDRVDRSPPLPSDNDGSMNMDDQEAPSGEVSFDALHDHFLAMESYVKKTTDLRRNLPRFYDAMQKVEKIQLGEQNVSPLMTGNSSTPKFYPYAYYLLIRLKNSTNNKQGNEAATSSAESPSSSTTGYSREIWFSIPHERVDVLYLLFLQWCVEEPSDSPAENAPEPQDTVDPSVKFIVIDDAKYAEKPTVSDIPLFTNPYQFTSDTDSRDSILLDRNNIKLIWQLSRLDEFQRRFSLSGLTETYFLPLPEGSSRSTLLNENLTRRLVGVLPARAQIYPWVLIYSSHEHGFSLRTMYNKMSRWHEDQSPTLLIVKDDNGRVFGAVLSCTLKVDEHFYGSGESLLFTDFPSFKTFRWTGANTFVVTCALDSLAIGAGKGTFGLYLDADFYHGRTAHCETFGNDPLTDPADFTIVGLEVFRFGFS